ncbi:MAG: hypothetical protein U0166_28725 [Acidobacteriota bacterium]
MEFRLRDFWYPVSIVRMRRLLEASQWWDEEKIAAFQKERLRIVVEHAVASVPYWRDLFARLRLKPADVAGPGDLAKLPVLTKDTVRERRAELEASDLRRHGPRLVHTSGSTGTPLAFYIDKPTNVLEFATLWRHWGWHGYRFGDRFADMRGRTIADPSGIEHDFRLRSLNVSSFDLTPEKARRYAEAMRGFRPVMVRGYPSSLHVFCGWMDRDIGVRPRSVITSSETLLDHQRAAIARVFGCPVRDYYGQVERVAWIGECERGRYHVGSEYGIVEVLGDDDRPIAEGTGRLVGTTLWNLAMPLLRYETRDLVTVARSGDCACGRKLPTVERIWGRIEDIVVTPDGRHVGRLDAAFKLSTGIRLAQIVQDDPSAIEVRIVPAAGFGDDDVRVLERELRLRLGDAIAIRHEIVADLERTAGGKIKFVVSRLPREIQEGRPPETTAV